MTKAETAMSHSAQFADGTGSTPKSEWHIEPLRNCNNKQNKKINY